MHEGLLLPLAFVFGSVSWRFLLTVIYFPNFKNWTIERLLQPLIAIHLFRYISISLLVPKLTTASEILPASHIYRLAGGDIACSLISMLTLTAFYKKWKVAMPLVVLLSVVGLTDLLLATIFDMPLFVQEIKRLDTRLFAVLTTFIPLVFVSHVFILNLLFQYWKKNRKDDKKLPSITGEM